MRWQLGLLFVVAIGLGGAGLERSASRMDGVPPAAGSVARAGAAGRGGRAAAEQLPAPAVAVVEQAAVAWDAVAPAAVADAGGAGGTGGAQRAGAVAPVECCVASGSTSAGHRSNRCDIWTLSPRR